MVHFLQLYATAWAWAPAHVLDIGDQDSRMAGDVSNCVLWLNVDGLLRVVSNVAVKAGKHPSSDSIRKFDENALFVGLLKLALKDQFDDSVIQLPAAVRDHILGGRHSKFFHICVCKIVRQL